MLGRRQIDTNAINGSVAPLRSSLADAAWAVEERLVWGGADALRRIGAVVKWPFEQLAWAIERLLIWPLQERTDYWSTPLRAAAAAGVVVLAAGAVAAGALLATGPREEVAAAVVRQAAAVTPPPASSTPPSAAVSAPVLRGVAPDFTPEADGGASAQSAETTTKPAASTAPAAGATASKGSTAAAVTAGPAAVKVARAFAKAFVLYETGRGEDAVVRAALAETATPQLIHSLLKRPPRLPANVEVPQAKVLNVVAGPRAGETYIFSVSLLRVGVTSELRIDMQRNEQSGKWQVTDVLG